jgi:transposase
MSQVTVITGRDRRRKWGSEERQRILAAAFAPGAVISNVARQFDIASSMIYKWRRQALAASRPLAFAPAIVMEDVVDSPLTSQAATPPPPPAVAITVEFSAGVRVTIDGTARAELVTATLRALQ